jgi:hypothetical protein
VGKPVTAMQENNRGERAGAARARYRRRHDAQTRNGYFDPLHGEGFRSGWRISARHHRRHPEASLHWL